MAEPEAGDLEDDEDHEDDRVAPDCDHGEQAPMERCRRHGKVTFVLGRGARVPRKSDRLRTILCSWPRSKRWRRGRVTEADLPAPDVSIVVTLFNEAASVEELYRRTIAALDSGPRTFELIFVDDGSTDGTFAAVERLHGGDPRVRAVRFKRNFGQHPAMHAGLSRARGDVVVTMDGDLQNQPEDIPRLVEAVEAGYDVASGRRRARKDPRRPFPAFARDQRDAPPLYRRGRSRTSGAHSTRTVATPSSRCSDRSASRSSRRL